MLDKVMNVMDWLRKIPGTFLFTILFAVGFIVFINDEQAQTLAVDSFREQYRAYLGPIFIVMASICVARFVGFCSETITLKRSKRQLVRQLHDLTPEEKGYLAQFVLGGSNTVYVGLEDGIMAGLCAKGIVYRASNLGSYFEGFAHNLQPWARSYLKRHTELLEGGIGQPLTPEEKLFGHK